VANLKHIVHYLGAAGEGIMVHCHNISMRATLPHKYDECLHASKDNIWAPKDLHEALSLPDAERWLEAMWEDIRGMIAQQVFELVDLPSGAMKIGIMWPHVGVLVLVK
jgi:hypothetical protein